MALREILASFGYEIDHAELHKGEEGVGRMIESLRHLGRSVGEAFAAYEVKEFVEKTIEGALQLNHAAIIAGTTAEKLQSLQFAAEASEVPVEALSMGLMRLQRSMFASGAGAQGAGAAYAKLGLDQKELAKKETTEAFIEVAGAIGDIKDPAEQTAMAMKIFGRGGAQLLPLMKKGEAGIRELREEVEKLGGGFTGEYIEAADKYHEASVRLHMSWRSFSVMITEKLVPALTWLTDKATAVIHKITEMKGEIDLGRIGVAAFVAVMITGISAVVSALSPMLASLALTLGIFTFLTVVAEDFMGMFHGDKSLIGNVLDQTFGEGAAKTFVQDVQAMTSSWENFQQGLATFEGTMGADFLLGLIQKVKDLTTKLKYIIKLVDPFGHIAAAVGGESAGAYNARLKKEKQEELNQNENDYQGDVNVNHAQYRAEFDALREAAANEKIVNDREAQLNQSQGGTFRLGPGVPTIVAENVGVPDYMTQGRSYVDKSITNVNLMPGSTDAQARATGAAVDKVRRDRAGNRAAANALEPAVE